VDMGDFTSFRFVVLLMRLRRQLKKTRSGSSPDENMAYGWPCTDADYEELEKD